MQPRRLWFPILAVAISTAFVAAPAFAQCEDQETDPIEDVAGVLDEDNGTLYTTESEEEEVVAALGLTPTEDGYAEERVVVDEKTGEERIETFFWVVIRVPWPGLFLPARPLCECASPFAIVYRHRVCRVILPGFNGGCRMIAGGGSFRNVRQPLRRCVLFSPWNFCVERNRPWQTVTTYHDNFCQIPNTIVTRCRFMC